MVPRRRGDRLRRLRDLVDRRVRRLLADARSGPLHRGARCSRGLLRRARPYRWTVANTWWCFAAGALLWLITDATYIHTTAQGLEAPGWVDWAYILATTMFYVGVILLPVWSSPGSGAASGWTA